MHDLVTEPWAAGTDVTDLSHTDLTSTRTSNSKVSDPSRELHRLVETLRRQQDLPSASETIDRALRVELAWALDQGNVPFTRADVGILYLVPPQGWVADQDFEDIPLVDPEDVPDNGRSISFSTAPTCFEMAQAAIDEAEYENLTDVVRHGVERMLGRR